MTNNTDGKIVSVPLDSLGQLAICAVGYDSRLPYGIVPAEIEQVLTPEWIERLRVAQADPSPRSWSFPVIPEDVTKVRDREGDVWTKAVSPSGLVGWYHRGIGIAKPTHYVLCYFGPLTEVTDGDSD